MRLRRTSTGVKPIVAVGRGRRVPTSDGGGDGSGTTAVAATAAYHQLLPVGSALPPCQAHC